MQTPQVSNPANVATSQPTAARPTDAGSSDTPFGQVLMREIAGCNTNDGGKRHARETDSASPARQPARNDGKSADAKAAREARQARAQDDKTAGRADAAMEAAMQASEDMLALVANLTQAAQPAGTLGLTAKTAEGSAAAAADAGAAEHLAGTTSTTDPLASSLIAPMTAGLTTPQPAANVAHADTKSSSDVTLAAAISSNTAPAAAAVIVPDTGTQVQTDATPAAATNDNTVAGTAAAIVPVSGAQVRTDTEIPARSDSLQPALADFAAKGRELLNSAPQNSTAGRMPDHLQVPEQVTAAPSPASDAPSPASAGTAPSAGAQEFSAAVKDSLSALTSAANTMMSPVQQAAVQAAQSMGNNAERLTPRVGTPAWDQALGQKVVWMVAGEQQSASLTLNPPDLGPLQVVLNVSNSQANATFTAAQPEVRQALEAAMPKLREMLSDAGIQLGQASVNSGSPNQQGAFEQQAGPAHGRGHTDQRDAGTNAESPRVTRVRPAAAGQGMVDTFA